MQAHTDHRQDSGGRKGRHTHQHIAACAVRQQRRAVGPLDGGAGCPADEMSQRAGQTQSQRSAVRSRFWISRRAVCFTRRTRSVVSYMPLPPSPKKSLHSDRDKNGENYAPKIEKISKKIRPSCRTI